MQYITIGLPEELTEALSRTGSDLSRAALEALATEAYRERKISHTQLGQLLGFETRMEVDAFLKDPQRSMYSRPLWRVQKRLSISCL